MAKGNKPSDASPVDLKPGEYLDPFGEVQLTVAKQLVPEYEQLVTDWKNCVLCPLSSSRNKVVLVRGTLPADVLFIGEAPGPSEDQIGFPFVGPSGKVLNSLITELRKSRKGWNFAVTNPVGCVPWESDDAENGKRFRQPNRDEIESCNPRFLKIIQLVNPKGIVLLGKVAEHFWNDNGPNVCKQLGGSLPSTSIAHPSYILRNGGAKESNMIYRNCLSALKFFLFQKIKVGV